MRRSLLTIAAVLLRAAIVVAASVLLGEAIAHAQSSGSVTDKERLMAPFARNLGSDGNPTSANVFKPLNALSIASEATVWTPASGKRFRLMKHCLTSSVAGNVVLRDNTAGTIIAVVPSAARPVVYARNTPWTVAFSRPPLTTY